MSKPYLNRARGTINKRVVGDVARNKQNGGWDTVRPATKVERQKRQRADASQETCLGKVRCVARRCNRAGGKYVRIN